MEWCNSNIKQKLYPTNEGECRQVSPSMCHSHLSWGVAKVGESSPRKARLRMKFHGHRPPNHGNISDKGGQLVDSRSFEWGCAVVPTAECSPSGILRRLRYGCYVDCSTLANDPPGIAKACEFGTHQFLEVGCIGGEVDGTM